MLSPVIPLIRLVVIISIALVAASVLCIFHVEPHFAFDLKLRDCHGENRIECLLRVGLHVQLDVNHLTLVDTKWLRQQQPGLVPMSGWVLWSRVKHAVVVMTAEDSIEVNCISVQNCRLVHLMLELEINILQVSQCAGFEVKRFPEWFVCKVFASVICVQHWLRELFGNSLIIQIA